MSDAVLSLFHEDKCISFGKVHTDNTARTESNFNTSDHFTIQGKKSYQEAVLVLISPKNKT